MKKGGKMLNWKGVMDFANHGNLTPNRKVNMTNAEWQARLSEEAYRVTRNQGTERRFSGAHCSIYEPGLYACVCCEELLFDASKKFDSGTGWPSFSQPITGNAIQYIRDDSHRMVRVEVKCNVCDAHLGHIFPDGPAPSKIRYCINSVSLKKVDKDDK